MQVGAAGGLDAGAGVAAGSVPDQHPVRQHGGLPAALVPPRRLPGLPGPVGVFPLRCGEQREAGTVTSLASTEQYRKSTAQSGGSGNSDGPG